VCKYIHLCLSGNVGDLQKDYRQEENTGIWQQEHQFQPIGDDDMMDYGGDAIDFGE